MWSNPYIWRDVRILRGYCRRIWGIRWQRVAIELVALLAIIGIYCHPFAMRFFAATVLFYVCAGYVVILPCLGYLYEIEHGTALLVGLTISSPALELWRRFTRDLWWFACFFLGGLACVPASVLLKVAHSASIPPIATCELMCMAAGHLLSTRLRCRHDFILPCLAILAVSGLEVAYCLKAPSTAVLVTMTLIQLVAAMVFLLGALRNIQRSTQLAVASTISPLVLHVPLLRVPRAMKRTPSTSQRRPFLWLERLWRNNPFFLVFQLQNRRLEWYTVLAMTVPAALPIPGALLLASGHTHTGLMLLQIGWLLIGYTTMLSVTLIAHQEKTQGTWDLLLSSGISPRAVLGGYLGLALVAPLLIMLTTLPIWLALLLMTHPALTLLFGYGPIVCILLPLIALWCMALSKLPLSPIRLVAWIAAGTIFVSVLASAVIQIPGPAQVALNIATGSTTRAVHLLTLHCLAFVGMSGVLWKLAVHHMTVAMGKR